MTAREVLDQIEQRAKDGPVSDWDRRGGDEPHHRVIERRIQFDKQMTADQLILVAALRAVLDLHHPDQDDIPPFDYPHCAHCLRPDEYQADWPCDTYAAITGALGADA